MEIYLLFFYHTDGFLDLGGESKHCEKFNDLLESATRLSVKSFFLLLKLVKFFQSVFFKIVPENF